jgi:hypothetical protein
MTKTEFMALCGERMIDVDIALENENLVQALKDKDFDMVVNILDNEF